MRSPGERNPAGRAAWAARKERETQNMKRFSYVLTSDSAASGKRIGSLAQEAARFRSNLRLQSAKGDAALREQREMSRLGMRRGSRVTVTAEGSDEEAAIAAIQNYFVANL